MNLTTDYSKAYEQITAEIDELSQKLKRLENDRIEFLRVNSSSEHTEFDDEIEDLIEEWETLEEITNRFELVIPVSQIASVNYFDKEVHLKYFPYTTENIIITR